MKPFKTVSVPNKTKGVLHIETKLGIVNIYVGLQDNSGHNVERVEYIPNDYAGQPQVRLENDIYAIRAVEDIKKA